MGSKHASVHLRCDESSLIIARLKIKSGDFQKIIKLKIVKSLAAQGFFLFVQFYLYDLIFS